MAIFLAALLAFQPATGPSPNSNLVDPAVEARVEATLAELTLSEKFSLLAGVDGFYTRDIPRLGVPRLKMSDGPQGVRNYGPTTAYPAAVTLAAAMDLSLAYRFGDAIARDAKSRGVHVWLAPGVNLARIPQNGRNFEYAGEDPLLAGRIAAAIVQGVQSAGVVATVKHFAANEHESDRNRDNSVVDERTLRELYLRPFEIAVKDGGPWAVMCSYNKLNGPYTSEHPWLLQEVLKDEWGFRGLVMSDWGAVHSTLGPMTGGLDLEMPGPAFLNEAALAPLLADGKFTQAQLDDKVRRILRTLYSMGYADVPQEQAEIPKNDPESLALSVEIARQGVVLLKNVQDALPLEGDQLKRVLVTGPNAERMAHTGGGSGYTTPFEFVSVVEALRRTARDKIEFISKPLAGSGFGASFRSGRYEGLKAEFFLGTKLEGAPVATQNHERLEFAWMKEAPTKGVPPENYSVRWTGKYVPEESGEHIVGANSDDGVRVWVDGKLVIDNWTDHGVTLNTGKVTLRNGVPVSLRVEYYQALGDAVIQVGFAPGTSSFERDLPTEELEGYDAIVVCTGFGPDSETEGADRPFELPTAQNDLVKYLAEAHDRVIVVNNSGAGVDMSRWVDDVEAVVQAWYLGGAGNLGLAEILLGKVNPSAVLPMTFPRALEDTYYESAYPPINNTIEYSEGLLMGYRWFDRQAVTPLFPFGHGLSYTSFEIRQVGASRFGSNLSVFVEIKNTGDRPGTLPLHMYVEGPSKDPTRPLKELKGWSKMPPIPPGQIAMVPFSLDPNDLRIWESGGWQTLAGEYVIHIGFSSRDLPIRVPVRL